MAEDSRKCIDVEAQKLSKQDFKKNTRNNISINDNKSHTSALHKRYRVSTKSLGVHRKPKFLLPLYYQKNNDGKMKTSVCNTPISAPAASTADGSKQGAPASLISEHGSSSIGTSSNGMLIVDTPAGKKGTKHVSRASSTSMSSENSGELLTVPALATHGSASSEPGTPTRQYTSADHSLATPIASNHSLAASKKDKSHRSSSLFSSSRKAGSKIVKTGVLRPARAVGRLVRGTSKGVADEPPGMIQRSSSGERGEVEAAMEDDGTVSLQVKTPNGYGTMNQSGHRIIFSANTAMPMTVEGIARDGPSSTRSIPALHQDQPTAASTANWPVHSMEALTRQLFLVCVAYIVGVHYPEYLHHVSRATEFVATAWITCIAILCLSFLQRRFPHVVLSERDKHNLMVAAGAVMDEDDLLGHKVASHESVPLLRASPPKEQLFAHREAFQPLSGLESPAAGDEYMVPLAPPKPPAVERVPSHEEASVTSSALSQTLELKFEHPSLAPFYVIDAYSGERIFCNSSSPHHISNDWFEMDMLALIRTPDADDANAVQGTTANDVVSDYLRGKARRWEFQYRVKLKKKPDGKQVYFACELDDPIKMGMVTKAFVSAAMAFMKKTNPTFHYSITGSKETPDGKWERPHMSFTVEGSLDRLVVTKPGEEPPKLGEAIYEDPESIKRRKKGGLVDWNTEDTFTMALWTSYVDFLDWRVLNLPGIRPFGLSSVLGTQPINLTMYLIDEKRDSDKHYRCDCTEIIKIELSNDNISAIGPRARLWKRDQGQRQSVASASQELRGRSASDDSSMVGRALEVESVTGVDDDESAADLAAKMRPSVNTEDAMEEIEEVDEDVLTAAELGEGIYLRSGDSVVLREYDDEAHTGSWSVANGGGFAVLQDQDIAIIIEKAKRSRKNNLIMSGDTVLFKLIQHKPGSDDVETRYLTIHRGWWLKWVTTMPTKNGFFTIFTHETELGDKALPTSETQSRFLPLGGTFTLRHKRWSKFHVGIAAEPSTTYGGRMMGLYNPKSKGSHMEEDKPNDHSDDEADFNKEMPSMGKAGWLKPLVLSAHESSTLVEPEVLRANSSMDTEDEDNLPFVSPTTKIIFSSEHSKADVPAWIEMMDRVGRVRQLTYVVRMTRHSPGDECKMEESEGAEASPESHDQNQSFMRLRTGKELSHVISVGQSVRLPSLKLKPVSHSGSFDEDENIEVVYEEAEEPLSPLRQPLKVSRSEGDEPLSPELHTPALRHASYTGGMTTSAAHSSEAKMRRRMTADHARNARLHEEEDLEEDEHIEDSEQIEDFGHEEYDQEDNVMDTCYIDDDSSLSESVSSYDEQEDKRGALKKGKQLLGKSAKLAKKTVVGTGKLTAKTAVGTTKFAAKTGKKTSKLASSVAKKSVKQSKKVMKGTVKTGKALIAPVSRKSSKPPTSEPKKKKKEKEDSRMGVSKRLRKLEKIEEKTTRPPVFLAGELCAPEQSCRTASRVLSRMSNVPFMSQQWAKCNDVLSAEVEYTAEQDRWFLIGNSVHLGVTPIKVDATRGELIEESLVARCLWESHWREEWCGMYESCVSFYGPLSNSPSLEIAYMDITSVRPLESDANSPLPGFPMLVLETAWLCHYIAFKDEETRDTFGDRLEAVVESHVKRVEETASLEQSALRKARFWQGFQTLSESSLSSGHGKWAKLRSKDKTLHRIVLNGRRMAFDCRTTLLEDVSKCGVFVHDLLSKVLTFSLESLVQEPESFIEFLDLTSQLRFVPLDEIDLSGKYAFCLFVNIYHCLLQHSLLLSINGPLSKKTISRFMRTSCYEIGGDVFSLAELQCCVIRGKMSKPIAPKPPYIEAPKKSNAYRYYALGYTDARVHFLLNTGDTACPASVPVMTPRLMEEQMNASCLAFMDNNQLVVDTRRRTVTLPKVCEVYRNDFGHDSLSILRFCVNGMDDDTANFVRVLLMDEKNLVIKFQQTPDQYHSTLKLRSAFVSEPVDASQISSLPETASSGSAEMEL